MQGGVLHETQRSFVITGFERSVHIIDDDHVSRGARREMRWNPCCARQHAMFQKGKSASSSPKRASGNLYGPWGENIYVEFVEAHR